MLVYNPILSIVLKRWHIWICQQYFTIILLVNITELSSSNQFTIRQKQLPIFSQFSLCLLINFTLLFYLLLFLLINVFPFTISITLFIHIFIIKLLILLMKFSKIIKLLILIKIISLHKCMPFCKHMLYKRRTCLKIFISKVLALYTQYTYINLLIQISYKPNFILTKLLPSYKKTIVYIHMLQILLQALQLLFTKQTMVLYFLLAYLFDIFNFITFYCRHFFRMFFGMYVLVVCFLGSKLLIAFLAMKGLRLWFNFRLHFLLELSQ